MVLFPSLYPTGAKGLMPSAARKVLLRMSSHHCPCLSPTVSHLIRPRSSGLDSPPCVYIEWRPWTSDFKKFYTHKLERFFLQHRLGRVHNRQGPLGLHSAGAAPLMPGRSQRSARIPPPLPFLRPLTSQALAGGPGRTRCPLRMRVARWLTGFVVLELPEAKK